MSLEFVVGSIWVVFVLKDPTHPTTIFASMLVLGMMLPILPLPLREGMYTQLTVPMITMGLQNPMGYHSHQI